MQKGYTALKNTSTTENRSDDTDYLLTGQIDNDLESDTLTHRTYGTCETLRFNRKKTDKCSEKFIPIYMFVSFVIIFILSVVCNRYSNQLSALSNSPDGSGGSSKSTDGCVSKMSTNQVRDTANQSEFKVTNKTIYLIRHCEKYSDESNGLSIDGNAHSVCLVSYFESFPLGRPQCSYGATSRTMRSIHTIIPVSIELKIPMHGSWSSTHIKKAVMDIHTYLIQYDIVLVAWEHHMIPELATALGCEACNGWNTDPRSHKTLNQLYDATWVLRYQDVAVNNSTIMFPNSPKMFVYNQNYINNTCQDIKDFTYKYTEY